MSYFVVSTIASFFRNLCQFEEIASGSSAISSIHWSTSGFYSGQDFSSLRQGCSHLDSNRQVQRQRYSQALTVQCLLGHMAAAIPMVPFAKLHMRLLQAEFLQQLKPHRHLPFRWIKVSFHVRKALSWWQDPNHVFRGMPFQLPIPSLTLTTDASLLGWGAHMGLLRTQDLWRGADLDLHINVLELKAVLLAVRAFLPHLTGHVVAIRSDNTTAISYINKQGGTMSRTLCKLALEK